jgi:hypothetical protein
MLSNSHEMWRKPGFPAEYGRWTGSLSREKMAVKGGTA